MSVPSGWNMGFAAYSMGLVSDPAKDQTRSGVAVYEVTFDGLKLETRVAKYRVI
jgi:hypothetical protein